jgi:16S rRNA (uracil1498-N3)-methyltransferase
MKISSLPRVYISDSLYKNQILRIENDLFHYLKSVIRMKPGARMRIFNQKDGEFLAVIAEIGKNHILLRSEDQQRDASQDKPLALALCMIKPDRMHDAIRMAVQIGVTKIMPIISEYTQYKNYSPDKINKIILEAVQQSERFSVPQLHSPMHLSVMLEQHQERQIIFASESIDCAQKITDLPIGQEPIILIGPEGGFSDKETAFLAAAPNVKAVSLGQNVLRSETAVAVALGCAQMCRT